MRCVVVPGFASRAHVWPDAFRSALETICPVVWLDQVEHLPALSLTAEDWCVGWSLGALQLARHPEINQTRGLITLGYYRYFGFGVRDQAAALDRFQKRFQESPALALRRFQMLVAGGEPVPATALGWLQQSQTPVADIDPEGLEQLRHPMPKLAIPVHTLVGETDPLCQGGDDRLPGGHLGFVSSPLAWAAAVRGCLT